MYLGGRHDQKGLDDVVDMFIGNYVVCKRCGIPELTIRRKGEELRKLCMACGELQILDQKEKYVSFF
jgi:translation initiation factor 2 beta subunit (eIF-2beta)/eIF-5